MKNDITLRPREAVTSNWKSYARSQMAVAMIRQGNTSDAARLCTYALAVDEENQDAKINRIILRIEEISASADTRDEKLAKYSEALSSLDPFLHPIREHRNQRTTDLYNEYWFVAMFHLAAVLDYMAGDLTSADATTHIHAAMTTVKALGDVLDGAALRLASCKDQKRGAKVLKRLKLTGPSICDTVDQERWEQFLKRLKSSVPSMRDTIDLRKRYDALAAIGADMAGWHSFAVITLADARLRVAQPEHALKFSMLYATAIVLAAAAELGERSSLPDHEAWYTESFGYLKRAIAAPGHDKRLQDWAKYDPSLAALRKGRRLSRFRNVVA